MVFGVNASPCLLNATLKHHISQDETDPGLFENLFKLFYVDDLVAGERGVVDCLSLYQKICLRSAYQKVASTCQSAFQILPEVLELICEDHVGTVKTCALVDDTESYAKTTVNHLKKLDKKDEHKVLGQRTDYIFNSRFSAERFHRFLASLIKGSRTFRKCCLFSCRYKRWRTSIIKVTVYLPSSFRKKISTNQNIASAKISYQFLAPKVTVFRRNKTTNSNTSTDPFSAATKTLAFGNFFKLVKSAITFARKV